MGFNKNPIAWLVFGALILFVGYRFYNSVQTGDGGSAAIGLGIALVIAVVVVVVLKRSASGQLEAVSAMRPNSLVVPVLPTNAGMPMIKQFAASRGGKAKGLMTAQVASFDREAAILWTGGKNARPVVSVPAGEVRAIQVRKVAEGMRSYNGVAVLVAPDAGVLFVLKSPDEQLQAAVAQIAQALGVDRNVVQFG